LNKEVLSIVMSGRSRYNRGSGYEVRGGLTTREFYETDQAIPAPEELIKKGSQFIRGCVLVCNLTGQSLYVKINPMGRPDDYQDSELNNGDTGFFFSDKHVEFMVRVNVIEEGGIISDKTRKDNIKKLGQTLVYTKPNNPDWESGIVAETFETDRLKLVGMNMVLV